MTSDPEPLVVVTANGLYCPQGDFYIDPWRPEHSAGSPAEQPEPSAQNPGKRQQRDTAQPVQTAVITHGHGDHLRHGSSRYILARPGAGIARQRLGSDRELAPTDYGTPIPLGATTVSLHPAGHILGSAQVRIEHEGRVWVVSGDYKRQSDPTCAPFEPVECDVFISEATFALPVYRWPQTSQVIEEIYRWWRSNRERGIASVLFCYALGKAQRVLSELRAFTDEQVFAHGAVDSMTGVYRRAGVAMLPTRSVGTDKKTDYRGALILAPPSAAGTPWMRRFGEHSTGFCSGWMRVRGDRRRRGYDRGFVISDHADWPALIETCTASRARRILLTHGYSDALTRYFNEKGVEASALQTSYGEED